MLPSDAMPNLFRSLDGHVFRAGDSLPLILADGTPVTGVWAGSATEEKLAWWLRPAGNELTQTAPVAAIALKAEDDGELIWADLPAGARLFFLLEAPASGKPYRLAKMVTAATTPEQAVSFRHHRFACLGELHPDGSMVKLPSLPPPAPKPPRQPELF